VADAFRSMDERVALAGRALTEEETVPQTDGVHTYVSVKFPLHDATGRPYAVSGISTDITGREREQKERARLAAIVQSSDDAIISKSLDGTIQSWNPGAQKLFGHSAEEAIGKPITMLMAPGCRDEEREILERLARGEAIDHFETQRIRKNGRSVEVSITISPLKNERGELIGASKIARDITEQRHAERRLQAQLAKLDLLSRTTRAIGERQHLHSILQVAILQLEEDLPIDFGCACLYEPASPVLTVACVGAKSQSLALQLAMTEKAQIAIDPSGLSRCVGGELVYEPDIANSLSPFPQRLARAGLGSLVLAPLMIESKVFGVLLVSRREVGQFSSSDTEFLRQLSEHLALAMHQAELYASLQRAYDDLRQSQQSVMQQERLRVLGQLASGIAHDINNVLSPATLYAELLLERHASPGSEMRSHVLVIQSALESVANTVARMKEFYRRGEPQLTHVSVDVNRVLEQVIDLTRARWSAMPQERGMVVRIQSELDSTPPSIRGEESEIRDAFTNLILNAVDAMPQGGTLTVRTRAIEPGQVCIDVIDTGIGMDERTRARCLEPFFTTKGERGTGLGLAMVYGMVERHGGEIQIQSEVGRGTSVQLTFPQFAPTATSAIEILSGPKPLPPLQILFIDDDPIVLKSLRDAFEQDGHFVVTADGGQRGIDTFRAAYQRGEHFAAVITDLGMPDVDGRTVASAIKSLAPDVPVILLTGWGHRLLAEHDRPASVDRVLSKPPKLAVLRLALSELTAESRLQ
jgi:PAS domain S-box-containing protein